MQAGERDNQSLYIANSVSDGDEEQEEEAGHGRASSNAAIQTMCF